jgi:DEAD/DEAH box helicase domain-containing protein
MTEPHRRTVGSLLSAWRADPEIADNIVAWHTTPALAAEFVPIPTGIHPHLQNGFAAQGIRSLYSHQREAWEAAIDGKNVVVVTGTASGKTLCYNLPVLDVLMADPQARALYIFPTKALAQDQLNQLNRLASSSTHDPDAPGPQGKPFAAVYDGDTPTSLRATVRAQARVLITNPDMLHMGILPHHTLWVELLRSLRYVVIDELHVYRGVFGSHVANVLRRLRRVCRFYGSMPQFILTSATIANPAQLAEQLVEAPVTCVDRDGSAHGARHFLIYNPPVVNRDLGLRRSSLLESVRLANNLVGSGIQTILFGRSRRTVELILNYLRQNHPDETMRGYRSGYLPRERREIEMGLRLGQVRAVVATNALELGIDIGSMDASLLVGYPGTIAATRQQAGRAGRKTDASLSILVTAPDALDQFLAHHPEYLFDRSPEHALINPNHLIILLDHLRCAAFELPFRVGDGFGSVPADLVSQYLAFLVESGVLHPSENRFFWMADQYPANEISLRSASPDTILLRTGSEEDSTTIGQVDIPSAGILVHPGAIYLHDGQTYHVDALDLERKMASLAPVEVDYFTEPQGETTVTLTNAINQAPALGCTKHLGEIQVTSQITGFRKVRWYTHENLGTGRVDLPPSTLQTVGYWMALTDETVETLKAHGLWKNAPNDYGPNWPRIRDQVRQRDHFRCQICGALEVGRAFHVHHKTPLRQFASLEQANRLDNLVTLCPACHQRAELAVKMRSGLAGLGYAVGQLAPIFLMCDRRDLGVHSDPQSSLSDGKPSVVFYDLIPAGIGLSERLFEIHDELLVRSYELVAECPCQDGCPSCIGPAGEQGEGGKPESLAILASLTGNPLPRRPINEQD